MNSAGWNAVALVGVLAFVGATCLATTIALFLGVWPIYREQRRRREQASLVRSQLLATLTVLGESIAPRSHPLDLLQREAYEPLQYLWMQAHLLEAEEWRLLSRTNATLLMLRNKPTVNHRQTRMAQDLIDQTCRTLERHAEEFRTEMAKASLTERLLPYLHARWTSRIGSWSKRIEPSQTSHTAGI